jgi:hypothetical protein
MKILQIIIHCLPREIDQLERVLNKLHESSFFLEEENKVIIDVTLNLNDDFIDWENSILDKQFFINKFNQLEKKSTWAYKTLFDVDDKKKCLGINDKRRNSINNVKKEVTHLMYLDLDVFFNKLNLYFIFQSLNQIKNQYHIISSELTKLWDNSWDLLSNKKFSGESYDFWKTLDPHSIEYHVNNEEEFNIKPLNTIKFGGGWFNVFSVNLLKFIGIPDSLGPYGLDDTYVMEASKLMKSKGYDLTQYILVGNIICENIKYSIYDYNPYEKYIVDKSFVNGGKEFKQSFRINSQANFNKELQNFNNKL